VTRLVRVALPGLIVASLLSHVACLQRPVDDPHVIVVDIWTGPNNLDPRIGTDEISQKVGQLIFSSLMTLDDRLQVVPQLAERLDNPDPVTYVVTLRQGVTFHDGQELTSTDVVATFQAFLDPAFLSPRKGAYQLLRSVEAIDRYTVRFRLSEPFGSFPVNLVMPIVPAWAGDDFREHLTGTGPYRFVRFLVDDRIELEAFPDYFGGAPRNTGLVLRVVPDEVMRALELRTGAADLVINDLQPDVVHALEADGNLHVIEAPGVDYNYIGLNLRNPILKDVRVRRALAHAVDVDAIVHHLRRGLARPAVGLLPPLSWARAHDMPAFAHDLQRAGRLFDEAGYPDPDGPGPLPRLHLTLKASTNEYYRIQATVLQEQLRLAGVALDVRTYEFATLYADVLSGNFQMYTLQWAGGAVADPDILRRVFHSTQTPPAGFNRGHYSNPAVDELLDRAGVALDPEERRELFAEAQRLIASDVPYVSLWHRRNVAVARRTIAGVRLSPTADFLFLKDVERVPAPTAAP
jgi:peptide/nickel transport system substrate-binding protein